MTTYSGLSDQPLTQQDGLGLGRAEDEDVEGHGAEDGEDDEDGQEDSLLVTLLLWTDEVLEKTSDVQISTRHSPSLRDQIPGRVCEALRSRVYI